MAVVEAALQGLGDPVAVGVVLLPEAAIGVEDLGQTVLGQARALVERLGRVVRGRGFQGFFERLAGLGRNFSQPRGLRPWVWRALRILVPVAGTVVGQSPS